MRVSGAQGADGIEHVRLVDARPTLARASAAVGLCLFAVGALLFPAYALGTPLGLWRLDAEGPLPLLAGWLVRVAAVSAAGLLGPAVLRAVSTGLLPCTRRGVVRFAALEAFLCAAPATLMSFLVAGGVDDLMRVLTLAFVLTALFSFAVLLPLYRRGWDAARRQRAGED